VPKIQWTNLPRWRDFICAHLSHLRMKLETDPQMTQMCAD